MELCLLNLKNPLLFAQRVLNSTTYVIDITILSLEAIKITAVRAEQAAGKAIYNWIHKPSTGSASIDPNGDIILLNGILKEHPHVSEACYSNLEKAEETFNLKQRTLSFSFECESFEDLDEGVKTFIEKFLVTNSSFQEIFKSYTGAEITATQESCLLEYKNSYIQLLNIYEKNPELLQN